MSEHDQVVCPQCNEPMSSGFVVSMSGLYWSNDRDVGKLFVPNMKTDSMYPENEGAFLQNPRYPSHRCRACGVAVIRYSE